MVYAPFAAFWSRVDGRLAGDSASVIAGVVEPARVGPLDNHPIIIDPDTSAVNVLVVLLWGGCRVDLLLELKPWLFPGASQTG